MVCGLTVHHSPGQPSTRISKLSTIPLWLRTTATKDASPPAGPRTITGPPARASPPGSFSVTTTGSTGITGSGAGAGGGSTTVGASASTGAAGAGVISTSVGSSHRRYAPHSLQ